MGRRSAGGGVDRVDSCTSCSSSRASRTTRSSSCAACTRSARRSIGIGERPKDWLDDDVRQWLTHYEQVASVVDEGQLTDAVRWLQQRASDRAARGDGRGPRHGRRPTCGRRCGIPGTSVQTAFLCRDKPAMKEALRAAGIPCARSTGATSGAEVRAFAAEVGFPLILKPPAGAGASGAERVDSAGRARGGHRPQPRRPGRRAWRSRSSSRATRGSTTPSPSTARSCTSSSRTTTRTCSRRCGRGGSRRSSSPPTASTRRPATRELKEMGRAVVRGARHRHVGHAHGVVLRAEGAHVLRDRLPAARRAGVGPLRRRQRLRHLPRVGDGDRPRAAVAGAVAPIRGRDDRAPPRPRRQHHRLRRRRRHPGAVRRVGDRRPPAPGRARRRSRWRPGTWPTRGCGMRHPDYDTLHGHARRRRPHASRSGRRDRSPAGRPPAAGPRRARRPRPLDHLIASRRRAARRARRAARSSTAAHADAVRLRALGRRPACRPRLRAAARAPTSGTWCSSSRRARASSTSSRSRDAGRPRSSSRIRSTRSRRQQPLRRQLGVPGGRLRDAGVGRATTPTRRRGRSRTTC